MDTTLPIPVCLVLLLALMDSCASHTDHEGQASPPVAEQRMDYVNLQLNEESKAMQERARLQAKLDAQAKESQAQANAWRPTTLPVFNCKPPVFLLAPSR